MMTTSSEEEASMAVDGSTTRLDGNAAGGLLGSIFPFDMTVATAVCDGCGARGQVASLTLYADAPGIVLRCPGCEAVLLRVVEGHGRYWLDLRGLRSLELIDSTIAANQA
jgi:hypothetical protein